MTKSKTNKEREGEELALSKNHSRNIRYRLRIQEDKEASEALRQGLKDLQEHLDEYWYNEGR